MEKHTGILGKFTPPGLVLGFSMCKYDFSILEYPCKGRVSSSESSGCSGALYHIGMAHGLGHMQLGEGSEEATGDVLTGGTWYGKEVRGEGNLLYPHILCVGLCACSCLLLVQLAPMQPLIPSFSPLHSHLSFSSQLPWVVLSDEKAGHHTCFDSG